MKVKDLKQVLFKISYKAKIKALTEIEGEGLAKVRFLIVFLLQ